MAAGADERAIVRGLLAECAELEHAPSGHVEPMSSAEPLRRDANTSPERGIRD